MGSLLWYYKYVIVIRRYVMRFIIALWAGKLINFIIKIVDNSRGSNRAGRKALQIDPMIIKHFRGIDPSKVLFITGTNGKSTTNNLIYHILKNQGKRVCTNLEGANLLPGIATALIKSSSLTGKLNYDYFIFETDERHITPIREQLPAANILITNLQRDQVQRNGDPDFIYRKVTNVFQYGKARLFINNNDPRSSSLKKYGSSIVTYGVEKNSKSFVKDTDKYVTMACPICHHRIAYDYYLSDGLGAFSCTNCEHKSQEHADYETSNIDFDNRTFTISGVQFPMPYEMPHMLFNYSAAVAVAKEFAGIEIADAAKTFSTFKNIGGRNDVLHYKGKTITYMRFKQENPETVQTVLNYAASDPRPKAVCLGLYPLKDFKPYYTNTFYMYDCDAKALIDSDVEKFYCFSDVVCYDTANWLIYEGVDPEKIIVEDTNDVEKILETITSFETDNIFLATWLHDFEAMKKFIEKEEK